MVYFVILDCHEFTYCRQFWGTGIRGLIRAMATLPQRNQELLVSFVIRDNVGRPPGELGVSKSMEYDISLQCFDTVGLVIRRKGIQSAKISHTLDPKCSMEGLWEKRSDLE